MNQSRLGKRGVGVAGLLLAFAFMLVSASSALAVAPTAKTLEVAYFGSTSASLQGEFDAGGEKTTVGWEYGTTTSYGSTKNMAKTYEASGAFVTGEVVTGLAPKTTYHYRAVATNASGKAVGEDKTFTTKGWTQLSVPIPVEGKSAKFNSVSCLSSFCAAVGEAGTGPGPSSSGFAEIWNGTTWSTKAIPGTVSTLEGVSCFNSSQCTAVGWTYVSATKSTPVIVHWNGTSWAAETAPTPAGATSSVLHGVTCPATNTCTAVGSYVNASAVRVPYVIRWTSPSWSLITAPAPAEYTSSDLYGISCFSGFVSGTPRYTCAAVGYGTKGGVTRPVTQYGEQTAWGNATPPFPSGAKSAQLLDVSCPPIAFALWCMASGNQVTSASVSTGYTALDEGLTSWKEAASASISGLALGGISCLRTYTCHAVGTAGSFPIGQEYTASGWVTEPALPKTEGGGGGSLSGGVSCWETVPKTENCVAVGSYPGGAGQRPLAFLLG